MKNVHHEKDRIYAPFLLAASFSKQVTYEGSSIKESIVTLKFSPKDEALELLRKFNTRTEPHIPAKDIFEALDAFWGRVNEVKGQRI